MRFGSPSAWWRRRSLRARLTLVATALFTLAVLCASVALLLTVGRSQVNTLDSSARRAGNDVAGLVQSNRLPDRLLVGSGGVSYVQVVDAQNRVVAASPNADAAVSMLHSDEVATARRGKAIDVSGNRASTEDPVRIIGVIADIPNGQRTVLVATDLGRVIESSRLLERYLLFGGPVGVLAMAALTWWIVGRTLRPVDALRRGAAQLSAAGLSRSRLPVPAAQDEIHSLATTLNDMLDRLDTATTKQRRFVGDAAHELRSPIASLRLQLEIAGRLGESAELRELAADGLVDVNRLSQLIDDLLALARSDERGGLARRAPVRLDDLVTSVAATYADARVPVSIPTVAGAGAVVIAERDGLYRVLVNLVDNAVRYARSSVQLTVRTEAASEPGLAERGWAVVEVRDDGPGVPANRRERVFDRFYRLDTARSRSEGGTGLGLSIVREIVTAHAGTVTLHDNEPGLRVRVRLPT